MGFLCLFKLFIEDNILGMGDHFQVPKVSEWTCTFRGWGTTSRSLRCLKVHVRYCVRTCLRRTDISCKTTGNHVFANIDSEFVDLGILHLFRFVPMRKDLLYWVRFGAMLRCRTQLEMCDLSMFLTG